MVWGLWHTPVLLVHEYPLHAPAVRVLLLMVGTCAGSGDLLGWPRLRSGSVWPATAAWVD
ncbi:hypothetical protein [Pseudonocardia oceani]|uniref:hypothetical protein n=1 Tax=Pseudonocardia oceani TaxID=2792013 RepID=UPI001CF6EA5B|nr:hypothetical protein [Pseudonocardia oceani]